MRKVRLARNRGREKGEKEYTARTAIQRYTGYICGIRGICSLTMHCSGARRTAR